MEKNKNFSATVIIIAIIASTGGLLFGFDTGVISGALPFLKASWNLTSGQQEWVTTAVLIGAFLGAILGGRFTDVLGRKRIIIFTSIIFAVGSVLCGMASNAEFLIISRVLIGVAIGISSIAVPLYISEISPAKIRGALVSSFQLMITIGIVVSYFSDLAFADESNSFSWRWMFYVGVFPAIILFIGMLFMPETPRWLLSKGRNDEGEKVLARVEDPAEYENSLRKIREELDKDKSAARFKDIFTKTWSIPIFIAIGIMFIQQFVGINTVIYYAPTIFLFAGFSGAKAAIAATVSVGIVNVLATVVSMFLIDKIGRRKLYFIGLVGMCISLLAMGSFFIFKDSLGDSLKWATVASILIYIIFFAISLGPLGWLIISEIFPTKYRGVGVSIGSFSNWFFNAVVAFTFLKLAWLFTGEGMEITNTTIVDGIASSQTDPNPAGAFFIYAAVAILGIIWGYKYIPETKGKTLEEIEEHWRQGKAPRLM
jgi:sugar porter (SP) family MFS transporter